MTEGVHARMTVVYLRYRRFLLAGMKGLLAWDGRLISGWFELVRGFGGSPLKSMRG